MKTVVFLVNQLRKSGPVNVLYNIVKQLDRRQFNPVIIKMMRDDPSRNITSHFLELGIVVHECNWSFWQLEFQSKQYSSKIEKLSKEYSADIIHAHGYHPAILCSYIRTIPTVNTIHNICKEDYLLSKGIILGNYMCYRFQNILKKITCNVVISKYMESYYSAFVDSSRLRLIYNGIEIQKRKNEDIKQKKEELGLPSDKKIILVSSAFSKRKNQHYIIEELKRLSRQDFVVIFIGKGVQLEHCKALASGDERFLFKGYVLNPADYISVSDFLVSASWSEGLPLAVIEALILGLPTMLSNIPPHREILNLVFENEELGFNPRERDAFAQLFEKIIGKDFSQKMIISRTMEYFSSKKMTEVYTKLYDELTR